MDKSKEYILMCEKAEEMQAGWLSSKGDWYYAEGGEVNKWYLKEFLIYKAELKVGKGRVFLWGNCYGSGDYHPNHMEYEKRIWLPTQGQLQKILNIDDFTYLVSDFSEWVYQQEGFRYYNPPEPETKIFFSMEQLWLAFVMKTIYNKIWRSGEWVKDC